LLKRRSLVSSMLNPSRMACVAVPAAVRFQESQC
jgi:hypothetical protein